ncbi:MAG: hypothetical protein GY847_38490 [Proteobacteria bacterium]|nr:hypothetical protein [Pseudomonadota bacterium]
MKHDFFNWMRRIARDPRISPAAYKVATVLGSHADSNGDAWLDQLKLVEMTGLSRRGVQTCLASLQSCGEMEVRWVQAGQSLPSGNIARRARPIYRFKFDPVTSEQPQASGELCAPKEPPSGEVSAPMNGDLGELSAHAQANCVRISGELCAPPCHDRIRNRSVEGAQANSVRPRENTASASSDLMDTFTERQRAVLEALRKARFYTHGTGEKTGWEAVRDPVRLAERLGGEGYLSITDPSALIHHLANWTQANRSKSKKDIDRFLTNAFGRETKQATSENHNHAIAYSWK